MVEGHTIITHKNKQIHLIDYSSVGGTKENLIAMIQGVTKDYQAYKPDKSILAIVNVSKIHFDMDTLKIFQREGDSTAPYEKKVAVIGVTGLLKVAYNFVAPLTKRNNYKVFDTLEDAKEWVVS